MLLDDVMSELDADRRARLVELLRGRRAERHHHRRTSGTSPGASEPGVARIAVAEGAVMAVAGRGEHEDAAAA